MPYHDAKYPHTDGGNVVWYAYRPGPDGRSVVPDSQRRVLVVQDDGYIEMAYWDGNVFTHDWPTAIVGSKEAWAKAHLPSRVPRVMCWGDLPDAPTHEEIT
jgi:hypothetical protein